MKEKAFAKQSKGQAAELSAGQAGEKLAAYEAERLGLEILARNYRNGKQGEVDIVARDGAFIVFIEVKTRRHDNLLSGSATEHTGQQAINGRKRQKIMTTAFAYLREHPRQAHTARLHLRFDLMLVDFYLSRSMMREYLVAGDLVALDERSRILHFRDIFQH
jgi:conserved hypothetical protein TIGR00252